MIDRVVASEKHEYTRRFHFGPELDVEKLGPRQASVTGKKMTAKFTDEGDDAELSLERGGEEPRRGWAYPGDRERSAVWTVELKSKGKNAVFATVISFSGEPLLPEDRVWRSPETI